MRPSVKRPTQIIWATRGHSWGFRFLLDGGFEDPLATYERIFSELPDTPTAFHHDGTTAVLRFPDPSGRRDAAGRAIPHEFIVFGELASEVDSVESGLSLVWPVVAEAFTQWWDSRRPPSHSDVEQVLHLTQPKDANRAGGAKRTDRAARPVPRGCPTRDAT